MALLLLPLAVLGQGHINYSLGEVEVAPTYLEPSSCQPTGTRLLVAGSGYSAQVWYAVGDTTDPDALRPLEVMVGTFNARGDLVFSPHSVTVPGTYGGDLLTLQIRAWDNMGGSVQTWADAVSKTWVASGETSLIRNWITLTGLREDGSLYFGNSNFARGRPAFTLVAVCPEPSGPLLIGLALGAGTLFLRRSTRCAP